MTDTPEQGTTVFFYEVLHSPPNTLILAIKCIYFKFAHWEDVFPEDTHPVPGAPFNNQWVIYRESGSAWHCDGRINGVNGPERMLEDAQYFRTYVEARNAALALAKRRVNVTRQELEWAEQDQKWLEEAVEAPPMPVG